MDFLSTVVCVSMLFPARCPWALWKGVLNFSREEGCVEHTHTNGYIRVGRALHIHTGVFKHIKSSWVIPICGLSTEHLPLRPRLCCKSLLWSKRKIKGEIGHNLFCMWRSTVSESLNQNYISALWKLELISRFSTAQSAAFALRSFLPQLWPLNPRNSWTRHLKCCSSYTLK